MHRKKNLLRRTGSGDIIKSKKLNAGIKTIEGENNNIETKGILSKPYIYLSAIIFITFLIYSNTFNAPFQYDDIDNIVDNPAIKDLLHFPDSGMAKNRSISEYVKPFLNTTRYIGYVTFALNYKMHNLDVRGYHLFNILIHIANSLLIYRLITFTFRTPYFSAIVRQDTFSHGAFHNLIAVFTTLLFAVHPIQTQAVTYIVQRFASLATFFYLLTLVTYIQLRLSSGLNTQKLRTAFKDYTMYAVSLLSAIFAMKTKEIAFTLPVVLCIYEFMFFQGKIKRRLLYLIPFVLTMLIIPLTLTRAGGSLTDIRGIDEAVANLSETQDISRLDYLYTQFRVIVTYIRLLFLPVNQNLDYDYPVYHSLLDPAVLFSFISLLLIFALGVYLYHISRHPERKGRYWLRLISFGIFWFFITLSVESSVIPIRDVIYEHRLYLPSAGFFMALTAVIGAGMERWGERVAYAKKVVLYVMLAFMLVLSGATYTRNTLWGDNIKLWEDIVKKSPNKARHHNNLGNAYFLHGRIDEAINEYQAALKLNYYYFKAHYNLGNAYITQKRIDEAINEYQTTLKISPGYSNAHNNLGNAYIIQNKIDDAISEYQTAIKLKPDHVDAHNNLGAAYTTKGQIDEAAEEFKVALELNPDNVMARQNLDLLLNK